ncbi:bifunctional nicotinamide-nucleotide adenylyltransferase/Nudix hydroxylase [Comamonas flocculans]|uniref:NUDIX domain-containing protein n=1 Tax=Comamonas flocculans TaxID=2597701 RepID=A0A5B8RVU2_9BURK|nr:bifunctional nicotinamide-nucleotide adenylyltransferase/Nudix hydroxylase [Comamonas flocculans]QEA13666.1 NUDIX domain-containing protein [Comamonas flocculans]
MDHHRFDIAVLIGRFQPVHKGHLALLQEAARQARLVVVVLGSAFQARTPRNPFTWQERAELLRASVEPSLRERLIPCPVRDYYDEPRWADAVRRAVAQHAGPEARVALVGHFKDASSEYLRAFPGWQLLSLPRMGAIDSTQLRDAWLGAAQADLASALAPFADQAPPATLALLRRMASQAPYQHLQAEWRMLRDYRQAWAAAPYPPVFVTVDALLRCRDQVLLVQRAQAPGQGLWALPGGFLEPHDTLWQSCLRELREETGCALTEGRLAQSLRSVQVFDHPDRSQRGRTITHVHHIDLDDATPPAVQGGDDAAQARWVALHELPDMEARFFEDHFQILDKFLHLL